MSDAQNPGYEIVVTPALMEEDGGAGIIIDFVLDGEITFRTGLTAKEGITYITSLAMALAAAARDAQQRDAESN